MKRRMGHMSKKATKINQLQQYLYNHYVRYPEDSSYNITYAYEFIGTLDIKRLKIILDKGWLFQK